MKRLLYTALSAIAIVAATACSGRTESERVRQVAVDSYRHFIGKTPGKRVDFMAHSDSMTEDYRRQLADLMAQHAERERQLHGGLTDVTALSDTVMDSVAYVFLELVYADSVREEVLVPLQRFGKEWKVQ